ncbi:MAG: hypothetical protein ACKOFA_04890, partial [Rhodoluna sp.]
MSASPKKSNEPGYEWEQIGLASPAVKALVGAKLYKVSDLRKVTEDEVMELHGMGKSALARIKVIMRAKKISFLN